MIASIQTRLLLAVGVLAVAAVAAVAFSARQSTRQEFERFQDIQRVRDTGDIDGAPERAAAILNGRCCVADAVADASAELHEGQALFVFNSAGELLIAAGAGAGKVSATFKDGQVNIGTREAAPGVAAGMKVTLKGGPVRHIRIADGADATVHVVPMPRGDADQPAAQFLGSVDRRLLIVTVAVALVALVATFAITRRITGPISDLRVATRDLAAGDLSRRVTAIGSDEVAELARAFNHMAAELERQETLRRNLVHDVAHELRTPLTALRCRVESVLDGMVSDPKPALAQINEEVAHLSQLVTDLDELARAEARELTLSMTDVRVSDVCRSAIRVAGLEGDSRVRYELTESLTVRADAVRLRQMVINLLTNADRHASADGVITVRVENQGSAVVVSVHNTGSHLSAEEQQRVFDRFYRADPSRQRATGGSGLGLAIVKQLADAQGATVAVTSDADGVMFSLTFA